MVLCFFYEIIFCCINFYKYIEFIIENIYVFKRLYYFIVNIFLFWYVGLKSYISKSLYLLGMKFFCLFIKISCYILGIFFIKEVYM